MSELDGSQCPLVVTSVARELDMNIEIIGPTTTNDNVNDAFDTTNEEGGIAGDYVYEEEDNEENDALRTKLVTEEKQTPTVSLDYIPSIGMRFDSYEVAYDFYNVYARYGGFGIRKHTSRKKRGIMYWALLVCNKEGFKKQKGNEKTERIVTRCGCKARLIVQLSPKINKWIVKAHHMEHNHSLHSPSKMYMHRSTKGIDSHKEVIDAWHMSGLRPSQIMNVISYEAGGIQNVAFSEEHVYSHLRKHRESYLGKDCQIALSYFQKKQIENPNFYYAIQTNEHSQVINCFWVDAIAREDYFYFGDVISFDTTYKKNKYLMPFAPFTGVNHHNQSILFGCALLGDEKKESFIWVFKEWLFAMGNKPPGAIITDQDPAMKFAIKEVFPKSVHRCCLWHIMQNAPKHIKFNIHPKFSGKWYEWFYLAESKEEFEDKWDEMVMMFPELLKNKWMNELWADRTSWSPHYSPDTFMAGMSTTQRSESMNNMFKKWLDVSTPLHLFVERFENALDRRRDKERKFDFRMHNGVQSFSVENPLLCHMRDTFTPSIFENIHKEFKKLMNCDIILESNVEGIKSYKVLHYQADGREKVYNISYIVEKKEVSICRCRLWCFAGIVCCHMISVFRIERVHQLPQCYILKRWTRQAKTVLIDNCMVNIRTPSNQQSSTLQKKHVFFSTVNKCLKEALRHDKAFHDALNALERLSLQLRKTNDELDELDRHENVDEVETSSANEIILRDRDPVRAKGCGKRIESGINANKNSRSCKICQRTGHDARTCLYNPKRLKVSDDVVVADKPCRKCNNCGGTGHDKRNCKNVQGRSSGYQEALVSDYEE